jgi:hypothetical protein
MCGVDCKRGEDREDPVLELRIDVIPVVVIERPVIREAKSHLAEPCDDGLERAHLTCREIDRAALYLVELRVHGHPVRTQRGDTGAALLDQSPDADLEELVEVATRDGKELRTFEERAGGVLGEFEHARVEVEPAEVAIDVSMAVAQVDRMVASPAGN